MQKIPVLFAITAIVVVFSYCSSSKKASKSSAPVVVATTYEGSVKSIIVSNCAPCHTQGGRLEAYDNYANAKKEIGEIIERVERNPGEKGFMPRNKPKLSDSTIAVLKKWRDTGFAE